MVLLYFSLIPAFRSFIHPLTIMTAIPLAMIGAIWSLLITNKTQSISANMGLILLAGIVVKNSILLIDFIEKAKERGLSTVEAVRESVRVRTRPILMTAFARRWGCFPSPWNGHRLGAPFSPGRSRHRRSDGFDLF